MPSGVQKATSAHDTDLAGLMNAVHYCRGLYFPLDTSISELKEFVTNILKPARDARNAYCHSARCSIDSNAPLEDYISALVTLRKQVPKPPAASPSSQTMQEAPTELEKGQVADCVAAGDGTGKVAAGGGAGGGAGAGAGGM